MQKLASERLLDCLSQPPCDGLGRFGNNYYFIEFLRLCIQQFFVFELSLLDRKRWPMHCSMVTA